MDNSTKTEETRTQDAGPGVWTEPTWAVVELMGHVKMAGLVSEVSAFGVVLGRIDIFGPDANYVTQFFSGQSVYRLTPTSEELCKRMHSPEAPVSPWDLREATAPSVSALPHILHDDEEDGVFG